MATAGPVSTPLETLAEQLNAGYNKAPLRLKIVAAQWNWDTVGAAIERAVATLAQVQVLCGANSSAADSLQAYLKECILRGYIPPMEADAPDATEECAGLLAALNAESALRWGIATVPGSLELPLAASWALKRPRAYDGVLAVGTVVRGQTVHFDLVCRECSRGLMQVALDSGRPVISGLLALEDTGQAKERLKRASDWAVSLVQMCLLAP